MSAPALPPPSWTRRRIPASVKLAAALINGGGIDPSKPYAWDHDPSLGMRPWNAETCDFDPPELDAKFIIPRQKPDHDEKTAKRDIPAIAKVARIAKGTLAHYTRMLAKTDQGVDEARAAIKKRRKQWPKGQKIRSRGFQRRVP